MVLASACATWTGKADVEMIVVAIPWTDLAKPRAVAFFVFAHLHLGTGKDKDTGDAFVRGCCLDDFMVGTGPIAVHKGTVGAAHRDSRDIFAVRAGQIEAVGP